LTAINRAAKKFGAAVVVRITADCPLVDPPLVDRLVQMQAKGKYD